MLRIGTAEPPRKRLRGSVVVVTGASAGVGRAAALAAAREGADVALIARSQQGLEEAAAEVQAVGARSLPLPLDVADAGAVQAAADRTEEMLGPIDLWINAAMATVFSPVSRLKPDEVRRVTEVTYLGAVNGTLAALDRMRLRGRGTIVQVGSALAFRGIPLQAPYCAAKHAIRGFTSSLRSELLHEKSAIRLVEVHLPAVNTPQFSWARTHLAEEPRPVGAVYEAEVAGRAIVEAALKGGRDWWLGRSTLPTILGQALAPQLMDRLMAATAWEGQFRGEHAKPREGNLYAPVEGLHAASGAFGDEARAEALFTSGPATRLGFAAAGAALFTVLGCVLARR